MNVHKMRYKWSDSRVGTHFPLCHLPKVLIALWVQCLTPPFQHPLLQLMGYRPLEAVDLGFQSVVPLDLPLYPQFLRAYSSWLLVRREDCGSARGQQLGAEAAVASWMALVSSLTNYSIASSSFTTGFPGVSLQGKSGMWMNPFVWS